MICSQVAIDLDNWLHKLSASKVFPVALGDDNVSRKGTSKS